MSEVVWIKDGDIRQHALIGEYQEKNGQTSYVFGVIYFGFPLDYGWDVRVGSIPDSDKAANFVVYAGDNTNDLEQAKRDAEHIGQEWIKGDSPIWNE
jgi:esterase/lipase superfamily enzyme